MRAFLNDGKGLGSDHSTVTNEYKNIGTFERYAVAPFLKRHKFCRAEIYYNWDNRYGVPSRIIEYAEHPMNCISCSSSRINGVFCHEKGCPNENKIWDYYEGEWQEPEIEEEDLD